MIWQQVRVTPYQNLPLCFTTRKAWTVKANPEGRIGPARKHCDIWSCAASSGRVRRKAIVATMEAGVAALPTNYHVQRYLIDYNRF